MHVSQQMTKPDSEKYIKKTSSNSDDDDGRGPKNDGRSILCQVANAQPLMDLTGEVTARDTSMHAMWLYVLMSGESERGAWKW